MTDAPEVPHNIGAEQALIGAILVDNSVFDRVSATAEDFYDPLHARIWLSIARRIQNGEAASPVLLKPEFDADEGMAEVGGPAYLARLAGASVAPSEAPHYAKQIADLARRREMIHAMERGLGAIQAAENPEAVAAALEAEMMLIHDRARPKARAVSFLSAATRMIDRANEAYQSDGAAGLTTGIPAIDGRTGGMMAPEVWVLGARSSMGKTAVALHMAKAAAESGVGALFCSLEMDPEDLSQRIVSSLCAEREVRLPYLMIRNGTFGADQMRTMLEATRDHEKLPLEITPPSMRSLGAIMAETRAAAARMKAKGRPLGVIFVDYLQKVQAPGDGSYERITNALTGMKELAVRNRCPVVVLAQLNREVEARANQGRGSIPRPQMSDLKGSGGIEEDADVIILLHRDEYYLSRMRPSGSGEVRSKSIAELEELKQRAAGKLDMLVEKFRNGARFEVTVDCDLPVNRILPPKADPQDALDFG